MIEKLGLKVKPLDWFYSENLKSWRVDFPAFNDVFLIYFDKHEQKWIFSSRRNSSSYHDSVDIAKEEAYKQYMATLDEFMKETFE